MISFATLCFNYPAADAAAVRLSLELTGTWLAILFGIILLHEFGHCLACRYWGGSADEILMWPLGGLAYCAPPQDPKAHFWTAAGGPLVNVMILCITAPTLGLLTGRWLGVALPSPFTLGGISSVIESRAMIALFLLNWLSLVLLLFNLLPIYPMDGGRLLQAILWPRLGYVASMRFTVRVGYVGAVGLGLFGIVTSNWMLQSLAILGGLTCWQTMRSLEFTEDAMGPSGADDRGYATSLEESRRSLASEREKDSKRRTQEVARRTAEESRRAAETKEFDRILDKIRVSGMGSLSGAERRALERETDRRRHP